MAVVCAIVPAYSESLLTPTQFPKTINDLSFHDKWALIAEGYKELDRIYDDDGNCVIGCPYAGITIEQDKKDVDEATDAYREALEELENAEEDDSKQEQDDEQSDRVVNPDNKNPPKDKPVSPPNGGSGNVVTPDPSRNVTPPDNRGNVWIDVSNTLPYGSPIAKSSILITSDFYFRQKPFGFHYGVDIGVPRGTNVVATGDGTIDAIDRTGRNSNGALTGNGPFIRIKHGTTGFYSLYLHLSHIDPTLKRGATVKKGDIIGKSGGAKGDCARCDGAHLHYTISTMKNGRHVYVDILCPWRATVDSQKVRRNEAESLKPENNVDISENNILQNKKHSAFNKYNYYSFASKGTKQNAVQWRIAAKHCMVSPSDKLPDEK